MGWCLSARNSVPGRKFTLSRLRSLNRTSTRLTIALSAPAFAMAALAASGGMSASAAAQPARPAQTVSAARTAGTARATEGNSAALLTTRATAATARGHRLGRKREIAWKMMSHRFGWRPKYQFRYVNWLWDRESSWNVYATNPYSGAYGIPQAVPGSKMASAGANWRTSASTQIRWGLRYIRSRYGKPSQAWAHERAYGWY
jgi:hypothetical protein